jgi:hypothetical protein
VSGDGLPCDAVELVKKLVDKAVGRLDLISHDKGRLDAKTPVSSAGIDPAACGPSLFGI